MHPGLSALLALQEIDEVLARTTAILEEIPRRAAAVEERLLQRRTEVGAARERLTQIRIKRREIEGRVQDLEALLTKYRNQLLEVKTNEAYTALLHEIERVQGEGSDAETEVLEAMETADALAVQMESAQAMLAREEEGARRDREELAREEERARAERARLLEERAALGPQVDPGLLARYERLRRGKKDRAVIPLRGQVCGGCYAAIPIQVTVSLRRGGAIVSCENCGRMVYCAEGATGGPAEG